MNFLAIECSTETLSLAASNDLDAWYFESAGGARSSSTLIPACLSGMSQLELQFVSLNAILYGKGPGSFTGLRTACSVAQGFSYASKVKTLGFNSLLTLAQSARQVDPQFTKVLSVLDARMGQLYVGAYEWDGQSWQGIASPQLLLPEDVSVPASWTTSHQPFLVASNTAIDRQESFFLSLKDLPIPYTSMHLNPRADALIELAKIHFSSAENTMGSDRELSLPTPFYLRDNVAQTTLERLHSRLGNLPSTS
jgi:tRNA threonylcarbamoyladenosine biosynthesis protein TsaB